MQEALQIVDVVRGWDGDVERAISRAAERWPEASCFRDRNVGNGVL